MSLNHPIPMKSTLEADPPGGEAARRTLRLLDELLFSADEVRDRLNVRLWDGRLWPDDTPRAATLVLKHPGALRAMLLPGSELGLAEAYLYDDYDVEGDLESLIGLAALLDRQVAGRAARLRLALSLARLPATARHAPGRRGPARLEGQRHSLSRDRQAIRYHYETSNDFFALWLGESLVYSCAYFAAPGEDLAAAQTRKLDYVCHKLRLRPGQRLLDVGCGWGGLLIHAARHYGCHATGITLSQIQARLVEERFARAGLEHLCRVEVCDYREMDAAGDGAPGGYDALASIGMFEHVGAALLPTYFQHARRLLKPGGVFLNHGIAIAPGGWPRRGASFPGHHIFPDGELVPINTALRAAEESGFQVRDVESLREHYTLTLRHWVRGLETHHDQALAFVDEPTYRAWRLFMSGAAHGFDIGRLNLYQSLLVRPAGPGPSGLPLTREDWYT